VIAITLENFLAWETATGKPLRAAKHRNPEVATAAFSATRNWYASAASNAIVLADANDDSVRRTLISANDTFFALTFSRDGKRIAAATEAGPVRVWDADTGATIASISSGSPAFAPAFSPDGALLAYARDDHSVRIIELPSGREARSFSGHNAEVISLAFADARTLLSTSADGTVRVWRW
jgi:WD40 repeat protein